MSLRRFAAAPERGAPDGEFLADSDVALGVEPSVGGWLAASGLCEAHPETIERTETTKVIKSANLKEPISRVAQGVGNIREMLCWPDCCCGIAAFTGGP